MKIAVISDIHSNLAALRAVIDDAARTGATAFWCLGDIVGYGPDPHECLALVRERATLCLRGNHDLGAIGVVPLEEFNPYAAAANAWTGRVLLDEERAFLRGLPSMLTWEDVTLAHASPREPVWEYVLSATVAMASFDHFQTRLCFVGHSHVPFICPEPASMRGCAFLQFPEQEPVDLGERRLILNPGSVGQPRDGDPRASYLLYDRDADAARLRRVAYDIAETQRRMGEAGLPRNLADRLAHGR